MDGIPDYEGEARLRELESELAKERARVDEAKRIMSVHHRRSSGELLHRGADYHDEPCIICNFLASEDKLAHEEVENL